VSPFLRRLLVVVGGVLLGALSGLEASHIVGGEGLFGAAPRRAFVPVGALTAPLVGTDGRLLGYLSFEAEIEVPVRREREVRAGLPVLADAVNRTSFAAPLAGEANGFVPQLPVLRELVHAAALKTYGPDVVSRTVITRASLT
jgi:hypothetical protein